MMMDTKNPIIQQMAPALPIQSSGASVVGLIPSSAIATTAPTTTMKKGPSLGLLAEVAITRLIEEQKNEAMSSKTKIVNRIYSLKQIRKLSEKKLLMTFAERLKSVIDKNQKLFSYKCQILPAECQLKFECRGSSADDETALKTRMIDHLLGHLCNLEGSVPNIKISSSRKVKSRNRTSKKGVTGTLASTASPVAGPTTTRPVSGRKGPGSRSKIAQQVAVQPTTTITIQQQSVITHSATPLDMTTTSSTIGGVTSAPGAASMPSPLMDDKKLLVLKFFEEDHSYTQQPPQSHLMPQIQHYVENQTPPISQDLQQHYHHQPTSVIATAPPQTVEIRTSSQQQQPIPIGAISVPVHHSITQDQLSSSVIVPAVVPATVPTPPPNSVRAMALDYIDDIRKKSSSAAKSIIVNGDKSLIYQCKICPDKQFTSTNGLIFHYKKHAGLKPYVCELCSATFTRQHSLNYHMLIHLNKSRFICSECGRHFRHPSHFKEHMRRHTGETPFQCGDCLIRFKTRNTYKRHLQTKHAKILTSKGIIELSGGVPYQSSSSKTGGVATAASVVALPQATTATTAMTPATVVPMPGTIIATPTSPISASGGAGVGSGGKPRRKYAIRYLHKNIETMNKYESSVAVHQPTATQVVVIPQGAMGMAATGGQQELPTVPLDYSQHHLAHPIIQGPGQQQHQNITILSIPSHAMGAGGGAMNAVHILEHSGANATSSRLSKPLVDLTDNVNYQHPTHGGGQAITLVSYQPSSIEPIQPTSYTTSPSACGSSLPISSGQLTELTTMTSSNASVGGSQAILTTTTGGGLVSSQHNIAAGSANVCPTTVVHQQQPQPSSNDNFMRLLEAIALTEDN